MRKSRSLFLLLSLGMLGGVGCGGGSPTAPDPTIIAAQPTPQLRITPIPTRTPPPCHTIRPCNPDF